MTSEETAEKIATLNDQARAAIGIACRANITPGVRALPPADLSVILQSIATFDAFTEGNNPHGERDFGAVEHNGARVFWKIDYYDKTLEYGSEDPADPEQTARVLTIMLASEY